MEKKPTINWLRELRKLERYCNKKGYAVLYNDVGIDSVNFDEKRIILGDHHSNEMSLYYLLHEMGHVVLYNRQKTYKKYYGYCFENFSKISLTYRIGILQEELDAWKEGLRLANRLKIKINRRKFEIIKSKCVKTYIL